MKQAQNTRHKQRGRPSSRQGGKSGGPGNRSEQRVRGNPKQLVEKYKNQAREALQAGDRTQSEYFLQFAEHYYRVMNETRSNQNDGDGNQNNQGNSRRRRGRGRGPQDDQQTDAAANQNGQPQQDGAEQPAAQPASVPAAVSEGAVNDAAPSKPVEVQPGLDLGQGDEKPAPKRRRAPRKKPQPADGAEAEPAAAVAE